MKDNKVVLADEKLDKDYLVTDPKKTKFSTKFIDICIACFALIGGVCVGTIYLFHTGIPGMVTNDIVTGIAYYVVALVGLIFIFVAAKAKSTKKSGVIYPLALTVFSLGNAITITYQRLSAGLPLRSGTFWTSAIMYYGMTVIALASLICYCIKAKDNNPRLMMASFALGILPTYAMIKGISVHIFGVVGEFIAGWESLMQHWYSMMYMIGTCFVLLAVAAIILGLGVRLLDRGDNHVLVAPRIVEKPVLVTRKPRRGLLIVKSPKAEDAPAAPEEGEKK